jgi:hypothetical protein
MGQRVTRPGITTGRGIKPDDTPPQEPRRCRICKSGDGEWRSNDELGFLYWSKCEHTLSDAKLPEPRIDNESEAAYMERLFRNEAAKMGFREPPWSPDDRKRAIDEMSVAELESYIAQIRGGNVHPPRPREETVYEYEPRTTAGIPHPFQRQGPDERNKNPMTGGQGPLEVNKNAPPPTYPKGYVPDYPKGYKRPADWPSPDPASKPPEIKQRWWEWKRKRPVTDK